MDQWPHNVILSFLARSGYHLQKLRLSYLMISPCEFIELLGQLPLLRILVVREAFRSVGSLFDNEVLKAMFCHDRPLKPSSLSTDGDPVSSYPIGTTLVPLLNYINIDCHLANLHYSLFIDMIESRLPTAPTALTTPIMFVQMICDSAHRMKEGMDALVPRGLRHCLAHPGGVISRI